MFKIVNSGDGGTGKTTFLKRYTTGIFVDSSQETIGTGFFAKTLYLKPFKDKPTQKIDLTIWDLGGQERFRFIITEFVMGAAGAFLFFDITRYTTFKNLEDWIKILRSKDEEGSMKLPILLVGTKYDLNEMREVEDDEIQEFVNNHEIVDYMETSSKTGWNIKKTVESLIYHIFETNKGVY